MSVELTTIPAETHLASADELHFHDVSEGAMNRIQFGNLRADIVGDAVLYASDFGAVGDGVTDDTDAFQDAINAAAALKVATIIVQPAKTYLINGALTGTGNQSRLRLPAVDFEDSEWYSIGFYCPVVPPFIYGTVGSCPVSTKAAVIKTTASGGALLGAEPTAFMTAILLNLKNVIFRGVDDPTCDLVDAREVFQVIVENCVFGTDVYNVDASEPTNGTTAFHTPKINNAAKTILRNSVFYGHHTGLSVNEHTYGEDIVVHSNIIGIDFQQAHHASFFTRIGVARNQKHIKFSTGPHFVTIGQLDTEYPSAGQTTPETEWQERVYDVWDDGHVGRASIGFHPVLGGSGANLPGFIMNGGSQINAHPIGGYPLRCKRSHSSTQSVADATVQDLVWNTVDDNPYIPGFDATSVFFNTTLSTSGTTVKLQGWYTVSVNLRFASNATGFRGVYVKKNGTILFSHFVPAISGSSQNLVLTTPPIYFNRDDIVSASAYQNSGGALNAETGNGSTSIEMFKVG